jgi:hypothetical protein
MAAKKSSKKAASLAKKMSAPETAVLMAFSSPPGMESADEFLECVVSGFAVVGTQVENDTVIVWGSFTKQQVTRIGRSIEKCLDDKGFNCPPLAGGFDVLREDGRTMVVSDLVQALIELCE